MKIKNLKYIILLLTFSATLIGQQWRECVKVIDGDTIVLDGDETVRLIGVDAPETKDPRKPVQYFGIEAYKFTKSLVEGKKVRLEYDQDRKDKYGRTLAYVYLEDGTFLNAEIIKQGYGFAYTKYPFKYLEEFRLFEKQARENAVGQFSEKESEYPGKSEYLDGYWWEEHEEQLATGRFDISAMDATTLKLVKVTRKMSFIMGMSSMANLIEKWVMVDVQLLEEPEKKQDIELPEALVIELGKLINTYYCIEIKHHRQVMEGIDEVYSDYANKRIPVPVVYPGVVKRIKGNLTKQEFEEILNNLRKVFKDY